MQIVFFEEIFGMKSPLMKMLQISKIGVWAKEILARGFKIIYDPEASVYHHHGLHQGNQKDRAKGVVSIIEDLDHEFVSKIPDSLRPENTNIVAVIPFVISTQVMILISFY